MAGHVWRFICDRDCVDELLECVAHHADDDDSRLTWEEAEIIASKIVEQRDSNHD